MSAAVLLPAAIGPALVVPLVMVVLLVALIAWLSVRKARERRRDEALGRSWTQEPRRHPFRRD